jgi:hypothetical protein
LGRASRGQLVEEAALVPAAAAAEAGCRW